MPTIEEIIAGLENAILEGKSCHSINPCFADQEMLEQLEKLGCIDKERCTHPNCPCKEILGQCLYRWKGRSLGHLTDKDHILILYSLIGCFLR